MFTDAVARNFEGPDVTLSGEVAWKVEDMVSILLAVR